MASLVRIVCGDSPPKKISLHIVQADSKIGELTFDDCFDGAVVNTGAAVNADISVDDMDAVTLRDSLNGAVFSTGAAVNASVSDFVSHDVTSNKYFCFASAIQCIFILACIL